MKIFLNPGHGGTDPGVCSKHGIKEADVALAIGLQLFNRLKLNGYPVELYQQKETYFEISKEENKSGATLFISIHCNGVSDPTAHGIEVLYCEGSQKGEKLAEIMQKQLVDITGLEDRGVKARSDLHVLNKTNAPAILVETAFLSNSNEETMLATAPELFADAIWEAIKIYNKEGLL